MFCCCQWENVDHQFTGHTLGNLITIWCMNFFFRFFFVLESFWRTEKTNVVSGSETIVLNVYQSDVQSGLRKNEGYRPWLEVEVQLKCLIQRSNGRNVNPYIVIKNTAIWFHFPELSFIEYKHHLYVDYSTSER